MKKLYTILSLTFLCAAFLTACMKDEGNYDYIPEEEIGMIKIDTAGMGSWEKAGALTNSMNPGDTIEYDPHVDYKYLENLRYRWFYLTLKDYQWQPIQVGNSLVYPLPIPSVMPKNWNGYAT